MAKFTLEVAKNEIISVDPDDVVRVGIVNHQRHSATDDLNSTIKNAAVIDYWVKITTKNHIPDIDLPIRASREEAERDYRFITEHLFDEPDASLVEEDNVQSALRSEPVQHDEAIRLLALVLANFLSK